jgi:hypothetical protein
MPRRYRCLALKFGDKFLGRTPLGSQPPTLVDDKSAALKFTNESDLVNWLREKGVETYRGFRRVWIAV